MLCVCVGGGGQGLILTTRGNHWMMPLEAIATCNQAVKVFLEVIKVPNELRSTDQTPTSFKTLQLSMINQVNQALIWSKIKSAHSSHKKPLKINFRHFWHLSDCTPNSELVLVYTLLTLPSTKFNKTSHYRDLQTISYPTSVLSNTHDPGYKETLQAVLRVRKLNIHRVLTTEHAYPHSMKPGKVHIT